MSRIRMPRSMCRTAFGVGEAVNVLAIDPGTHESAYVLFDGRQPVEFDIVPNGELRSWLPVDCTADHLAVEMIASYGMPVGAEVFETCVWIGRFVEAAELPHTLVYRREVKSHLCGSARAKDANVAAALRDIYRERFGLPTAKAAVGLKATPGPLYGFKSHLWAALGVAETWWATRREDDG